MGEGVFLGISHASTAREAGPQHSLILEVSFYLRVHPLTQQTKYDVVTQVRRGLVLVGQPRPRPKGVPQRSPVLGFFSIYESLKKSDQTGRANTCGGGACF